MKEKDPFKKFQESIENLDGNLHVLDSSVPVEMQMEFFRYSEMVRKSYVKEDLGEQMQILESGETNPDLLRHALSFLSVSGEIGAYRAIEAYTAEVDKELSDWRSLALMQARIVLESKFSDEKQIFISTGLGGKGEKLRFYAFFKSDRLTPFSAYQKELIDKEFSFSVQKREGEIEQLTISELWFSLVFLISIHENVKTLLEETIEECNQYGNFIDKNFVITNIKVFGREDIQNELLKDHV